ncbi:MAG: nitrophenyl compound nitroreductase subunit ArsF family protein [Thermoguttaceae bacterium]|nr:nitrophenyl compound nitroreductase subunit ArsF family protein [Thermoguttaceae bacterium]
MNLHIPAIFCTSILFSSTVGMGATEPPQSTKQTPPSYWSEEERAADLGIDLQKTLPDTYATIIYFHRLPSCPSCQKMAKHLYRILKENFGTELRERQIVLKYANFEEPKNRTLVEMFGIKKPSIILVHTSITDGVRAKKADQIWQLVTDDDKFCEYLLNEITAFVQTPD